MQDRHKKSLKVVVTFIVNFALTSEEHILNTFTQLGGMLNIPLSIKASKVYGKRIENMRNNK